MAEQPIDYGKEMFRNVDPKAVVGGVKDSIIAWWHEFSPGTIGKEAAETFDRVASRVKNEPLKKFLQDRKDVVRPLMTVAGVNMMVLDGVLATVPLYLKWQGRLTEKVNWEIKNRDAIDRSAEDVLTSKDVLNHGDYLRRMAQKERNRTVVIPPDILNRSKKAKEALARGRAQGVRIIRDHAETYLENDANRTWFIQNELNNRLEGYNRKVAATMAGLAGVEAAVFTFRPATRLAKVEIKAGEKVGSWVVDHIVNTIVRGGGAAPEPVAKV